MPDEDDEDDEEIMLAPVRTPAARKAREESSLDFRVYGLGVWGLGFRV